MTFTEMVTYAAGECGTYPQKRIGFKLGDMPVPCMNELVASGRRALVDAGYANVRAVGIYEGADGCLVGFGHAFEGKFAFVDE